MILAFREVLLCASVYELMTLLCTPMETHCQHGGSGAAKLQYDSDQWLFEVGAINRLKLLLVVSNYHFFFFYQDALGQQNSLSRPTVLLLSATE